MTEAKINEIVDYVFECFQKNGSADYIGEDISQVEHAAQSAELAEAEGWEEKVVLAALFHDIGHIIDDPSEVANMGGFGVQEHEKLGGEFLRNLGFNEDICTLVENHVSAKRYLTYAKPEYYNLLSEASKETLRYQGGPMNADEAAVFEASPLFEASLKMREWDERAKEVDVPLPDFERYKEMARRHLAEQ